MISLSPTADSAPADDEWLSRLSRALTSMSRRTRSADLYEQVAGRAGVDVRGHLLGPLFRIRELEPVRISDVAESLGSERSTVSRQVTELAAHGLVARERDTRDGRATLLRLTDRGRAAVAQVERTWLNVLGEATGGWSDAQRRSFVTLLSELEASIGERLGDPLSHR